MFLINMKKEEKKEPSLGKTVKAGVLFQKRKKCKSFSIKKANQWASWIASIIFALLPVIICVSGILVRFNNINLLNNYKTFITEFFNGGSFLWLSITVLVMSLLDLLLYEIKKMKSKKSKFGSKIFILLSILFAFMGIWIYISNIENPIDKVLMFVFSCVTFVLFCVISGIITFKIREV